MCDQLPESFCIAPWIMVNQTTFGKVIPCYKYDHDANFGKSLKEYYTSDALVKLKRKFLQGEKPKECSACFDVKHDDNEVLRKQVNKSIEKYRSIGGIIDETTVIDPLFMLVPVGNKCNLACPICASYSSSKWKKEEEIYNEKYDAKIITYPIIDNFKNISWMEDVKGYISNLHALIFHGGEPMFVNMKEHASLLEFINANSQFPIELRYATNGMNRPSAGMLAAWEKCSSVELMFSIDGIGDHYEYCRWPGNWEQTSNNVDYYIELKNTSKINLSLGMIATISVFNITKLPELYEWAVSKNLDKSLRINILILPNRICVQGIPPENKKLITEHLQAYKNPRFKRVLDFMNAKDTSKLYYPEFIKWLAMIEEYRNLSYVTQFPDDARLLGITNSS